MLTARPGSVALDPAQWMERALTVLALRLRHEVALTRALRGDDRREGFLGLLLSDGEAERILDEISGRLAVEGGIATQREVASLREELVAARRADRAGIWAQLEDAFDLAEPELDVLLLAAAPALDPRFGRVFGYLNDDMARRHLTPALVQRLLGDDLDALTLRRMLADDAPLLTFGILQAESTVPMVERALRIDEAVVDLLLGAPLRPPCPVVPLGPTVRPSWSLLVTGGTSAEISLAVLETAKLRGWSLCLVPENADQAELRSAVRTARLTGVVPVVTSQDDIGAESMRQLAPLLSAGAVIVTAAPTVWLTAGLRAEVVTARPIRDGERKAWLAELAGTTAYPKLQPLLTHARHLDLLKVAAAAAGDPATVEVALRAQLTGGLAAFAQPIETTKSLDDLVLPPASRVSLARLVTWPSAGARVLDDWGLGGVFDKRPGLVALFKGPSGTGKTMAAGAVARALGLPAFRVDLAAMVSKYIGETEKNLEQLFAAAEESDGVLFFDEADAIFGQRSEVSDAHDRYANLETSYLLQRLERFDGIAVLATNLAQNMDPAFLRRIDMVVEFPAPDARHRRALWERGAGTDTPLAPDLDLDLVAERFELTGGEIRNCWLDAAHRAAVSGCAIGLAELMQAIGTELVKQGKPLRKADFGEHYVRLGGSWP